MPERYLGKSLGKYRVEELVGSGGFAWVYRGFDPELEIPVALKVLKPQFAGDPTFEERFRREASTAAKLRHPNIVKIYAVGRDGDAVYFAITLTENCTFTFPTGLTSGELVQFWVYLKQDATGGRSVTWPSSVKWAMDIVPALDTTLSTLTILHFQSLGSDSRWYGEVLGMGYAI